MAALIEGGVLPFYAHSIALIIPLAGLLAYRREGNPFTWHAFVAKSRLFSRGCASVPVLRPVNVGYPGKDVYEYARCPKWRRG